MIIKQLLIIELVDKLDYVNSLEDMFDIAVIEKNNWQMYGSCKPNNQTYKLTNIIKIGKNKRYENNFKRDKQCESRNSP